MNTTKNFQNPVLALAIGLVLLACASKPALLPGSAGVPDGIDMSGLWRMRVDPGAKPMPGASRDSRIVIPPADAQRRSERRRSKRSSDSTVQVFLETGELLKISQTRDGLFISFDRAVVEEYTFGEDRRVSVGPIEAQRVSGWQNGVFVVETLDAQGSLLRESWYLDTESDLLVRDISVLEGDEERFAVRQRFDRN